MFTSICTRPTRLGGFYYISSLKQSSAGRHVAQLKTHYPDSEPTSLCFFLLNAACLAEKQQMPMLKLD
jgi:hypothetical protein